MSPNKSIGITLTGERITLSPLSPEDDLQEYLGWVNDQELTRYMEVGKNPVTEAQLRAYIKHYNERDPEFLLGIVRHDTKRHIGNITLHRIDSRNRVAEIGIFIGDRASHGQGFGLEAVRLVMFHAFNQLNLHKLTAGAVAGNTASQRLFAKAGFSLEGTLREQFFLDGQYYACYRYGILRREFTASDCRK